MSGRTPPEALPRSLHEIWETLREADESAASRQALARDLGVATHTLQRLLVRGDVPAFPHGENRVTRAWARTLARLAEKFGRDPREWVEKAGIEWRPDVEAAVRSALRGPSAGAAPRAHAMLPARRAQAQDGALRVAIVRGPALAAPLRRRGASFLEVTARRLAGALRPGHPVEMAYLDEPEALAELQRPGGAADLAAGVVETTARRAAGVRLVTLPGWRARVQGIAVRRDRSTGRLPQWSELEALPPNAAITALDEVGRDYLVGQRSLASGRLPLVRARAGLAEEASRRLDLVGAESLVLVGLEWSCRSAREILGTETEHALRVEDVPGSANGPSYPIAIARSLYAPTWTDALEAARDEEMFANAVIETSDLYAEIASMGTAPVHFDAATQAFQDRFCVRLLELLAESASDAGALDKRLREIAAAAKHLVPREWTGALDAALTRLPSVHPLEAATPGGSSRFCRSCSVSLIDEHNRGVSDRYCRFCSDDSGQLKPRDEVRRLIAGWIARWQGVASEAESLERADRLMSAMPAWSRN